MGAKCCSKYTLLCYACWPSSSCIPIHRSPLKIKSDHKFLIPQLTAKFIYLTSRKAIRKLVFLTMEDVSTEEIEKDQANSELSPPRKKSKITDESSFSEGNTANPPQPLIPSHLRHKIDAHTGQCNSVLFLNNSDYLVSGGKDNAIKLWDTTNGALTRYFEGFQGSICDIAISSDNKFLLAGLTSQKICIWDLNSGQILQTLEGHKQKVCAVCISSVRGE